MAIQALVHFSESRSPCALVSFNGSCDDDILQSVFLLHISLKGAVVGIDIYDGGFTKKIFCFTIYIYWLCLAKKTGNDLKADRQGLKTSQGQNLSEEDSPINHHQCADHRYARISENMVEVDEAYTSFWAITNNLTGFYHGVRQFFFLEGYAIFSIQILCIFQRPQALGHRNWKKRKWPEACHDSQLEQFS